jgi:integrase
MSRPTIKEKLYTGHTEPSGLRPLPSHVRYVDEYDDNLRTIHDPAGSDVWRLRYDTHDRQLDFRGVTHAPSKSAFKWLFIWLLNDLSPATVFIYHRSFLSLAEQQGWDWVENILSSKPSEWAADWEILRPNINQMQASFIKACLYFLSEMRIGEWNLGLEPFIRSLPFPPRYGKYKGILSGEAFLTIREESLIVEFLDETARSIRAGTEVSPSQIIDHCLLTFCYEHGFRPVQIGRIPLSAFRIHADKDGEPIVHFKAHRAKQRDGVARKPFIRRIKREWAAPFTTWISIRNAEESRNPERRANSVKAFPQPISRIIGLIGDASEGLTGVRRTATDFRHSVAQRLSDSGASVEEIAAFLGHTRLDTALVYFEQSGSQAEQVNRALALSDVYGPLAHVAATKTIDKAALLGLPPAHQVGAVPHGIPVSGIGGCDLGQNLCELNPALSCYTCRKFIPIDDPAVHMQVLEDFRKVSRFFFDESRGDRQSPAFAQLRVTLEAIQQVIDTLSGNQQGETNYV